ncbi:MAG: hypothetical protein JXA21_20870 [Anaerolineae bacterium]|nr:hypothetical protein [Anaerolineae bacterium]
MSLQSIFVILILLFVGGVALSFVILFVTQIGRVGKGTGRLQGIVNQMQAQGTGLRSAWRYPIVAPTLHTGTALAGSIILLLVGLIMISAGGFMQQHHINEVRLLEKEGVVAVANVTAKRVHRGDDSDTYYVTFAFTAAENGQQVDVKKEAKAPRNFYDHVEYGSKIEVVYAHSAPRLVRIRALYTPGKVEYWWMICLGGAGVLCLLFAWMLHGIYRNASHLDSEGVRATTLLLDRFEHSDSDSTSYYVAYDLPGVGPIRHSVEKGIYDWLVIGDTVNLVYLPDNPKIFRPLWR